MADSNGPSGNDEDFKRRTQHSDHLITLIANSGQASQAWLKFLITIQGALWPPHMATLR
jgi:hypothetical protein